MGKLNAIKKLKTNSGEATVQETRNEKNLKSYQTQNFSSNSSISSDSSFYSSSDSSDDDYQKKIQKLKIRKLKKKKNRLNCSLISETISTIENKIGVCPDCKNLNDESPMIGCDACDSWYHMACHNITVAPEDDESWFCKKCVDKKKQK